MKLISSIRSAIRYLLCLPPTPTPQEVDVMKAAAAKREARAARRQVNNAFARSMNPCIRN